MNDSAVDVVDHFEDVGVDYDVLGAVPAIVPVVVGIGPCSQVVRDVVGSVVLRRVLVRLVSVVGGRGRRRDCWCGSRRFVLEVRTFDFFRPQTRGYDVQRRVRVDCFNEAIDAASRGSWIRVEMGPLDLVDVS